MNLKKSRLKGTSEEDVYFKMAQERAQKGAEEDTKSATENKAKELKLYQEQMAQHQLKLNIVKKEREVFLPRLNQLIVSQSSYSNLWPRASESQAQMTLIENPKKLPRQKEKKRPLHCTRS